MKNYNTGGYVYCPFANKWQVVLLTNCPQICVRKKNSRPGFLDVSFRNSTKLLTWIEFPKLYRLTSTSSFFALHKYFDTHFWGQCVMPGVVWWVVWAESPI